MAEIQRDGSNKWAIIITIVVIVVMVAGTMWWLYNSIVAAGPHPSFQ